jgi:hypothetical protein
MRENCRVSCGFGCGLPQAELVVDVPEGQPLPRAPAVQITDAAGQPPLPVWCQARI